MSSMAASAPKSKAFKATPSQNSASHHLAETSHHSASHPSAKTARSTETTTVETLIAETVASESLANGPDDCRAAFEELSRTGYGSLARIAVSSRGAGHLRLDGAVPTFYLKQIAQETVLRLANLQELDNFLTVVPEPRSRVAGKPE